MYRTNIKMWQWILVFLIIFSGTGYPFIDVATYQHPACTLMARISMPQGDGPFPVVLAIHGGGFRAGDRTWFKPAFHQHYNELGIAVMACEYRLVKAGGAYPTAIRDCMHNLHWLIDHANQYSFDTGRIVVQGSSAGSYLAMMLALTSELPDFQPDFGPYQDSTAQVKAVISSAGMYDWSAIETGGAFIDDHRNDPRASPVYRCRAGSCHYFCLLGGVEDSQWSPPFTARAMCDSLKKAGHNCRLFLKKEQGHPGLYDDTDTFSKWAFARIDGFLVQVLGDDRP